MRKTVDVSFPVGPVHPCWKEPARVKCETKGELVMRAEVELGYMKKGIEKIMRGRPWQEVMFLAERVCGICSVIHNMVFIETMEEISGIAPAERAAYLRVVANELDRLQSHLLANFSYCYTIEHETLGMYLLDLREKAMDLLEMLTGARVNKAYIVPGGVRFDISEDTREFILMSIPSIREELERYRGMFSNGPMIGLRSRGIGILTKEDAMRCHAVGPTARASGIAIDLRTEHPTYRRLGFTPVVRGEGDNYARVMVRFDEALQSLALVERCLQELPRGPVMAGGRCIAGETVHRGEAPRGELSYFVKTDEFGRIAEISIQTPSIMNIEAAAHYMLVGATSLADVTSIFISADPCIACTER